MPTDDELKQRRAVCVEIVERDPLGVGLYYGPRSREIQHIDEILTLRTENRELLAKVEALEASRATESTIVSYENIAGPNLESERT